MTDLERAGAALCDWFDDNMRPLPWRENREPYRIWVSEVMLQQTRVETVIGYFERFMARFPTVQALAAAQRDEVLKLWEGLGYYRRADYLLKGAAYIVNQLGGVFPRSARALEQIPGIGAYTAGAIASMAFGERVAAVDGNVLRVTSRIAAYSDPVDLPKTRAKAGEISLAMMPEGRAWSHTQAMMELGACLCLPRNPRCNLCPVQGACRAFALGLERALPVRGARRKQLEVNRDVYMISDGGRVLLRRRPDEGLLRGMWEFPGEEEDTGFLAGFTVLAREKAVPARHVFTHRIWQMQGWWIEVAPCAAPEGCCWADAEKLEALALPAAMAAFRAYAAARLGGRGEGYK